MNPASFIQSLEAPVAQYPLVALFMAAAGGVLSASTCPCTLPAGVGLVSYVGYQVASVGERARRRSEKPRRGGASDRQAQGVLPACLCRIQRR